MRSPIDEEVGQIATKGSGGLRRLLVVVAALVILGQLFGGGIQPSLRDPLGEFANLLLLIAKWYMYCVAALILVFTILEWRMYVMLFGSPKLHRIRQAWSFLLRAGRLYPLLAILALAGC
jgi:hypothetical protein